MNKFGKIIKRLLLLNLFFLIFLCSDIYSKDFKNLIFTYDEYKKSHPHIKSKINEFKTIIKKNKPPKLSKKPFLPVKITIIYPGNQASDYWRRSQSSFEARLKEAGLNYSIESYFTRSGSEIHIQEEIINNQLKKKPEYLIFTLDALRHKTLVEKIMAHGSTKIILQNITTPLKEWMVLHPFLYVGFDHEEGSILLAREFIRRTGGKGEYAVFFGPRGYVSQMRGDTFIRYIAHNSSLRPVSLYYVGFNRDRAKKAALELLKKDKTIKFIYACSTDIAIGVSQAIKEMNLTGKILVNGWGGGSSELKLLRDNELDFTIMRINDDNGVAMADAILLDINGMTSMVPRVFSGDIVLVTRESGLNRINELKKRAFRYSNNPN